MRTRYTMSPRVVMGSQVSRSASTHLCTGGSTSKRNERVSRAKELMKEWLASTATASFAVAAL